MKNLSLTKTRINRREFLRLGSVGTASALAFRPWQVAMAGPFTPADFDKLVPADKRLSAAWVKSLYARGEPEILRGSELKFVGMPVGGLCAGQLYLGGDGRLWHWDIFNQPHATGSEHYAKPLDPGFALEQGFALRFGGKTVALDRSGFSDVSFRGEYPIGRVKYRDAAVPLGVTLEAFSPFIPLNTDDSSLPATVMQFTLENTSATLVEVALVGTLENAVLLAHRAVPGIRRNRVIAGKGFTFLNCSAEASNPPGASLEPLERLSDFGTMGLALLGAPAEIASSDTVKPVGEKLTGELGRTLTLAAGQSAVVTFVLTWFFPNLTVVGIRPNDQRSVHNIKDSGRYYAVRFADAAAVARYCAENFDRLAAQTRQWRDVWYDSTLPYWFLDRTQLNTSTLATSTSHRFASGRFWAWEGVGCCAGTCAHVWHYAHAMARQFPELERIVRERSDFGLAQQPDGAIHFRGEANKIPAIDAQAGSVLRALREHQMSADDAFLRRIWPGVQRATDWLIAKDGDGDGLIGGNQHNTLDGEWFGSVAWLSGLYLAALAAAATLADEMGEAAYAEKCRAIFARGQKKIVAELFDGEYFINKVDSQHLDAINSGTGCEIDQVMGQSWAFQLGLPRVLPEKETKAALQSLWKYNFSPDVGPYRERYKAGRWYAMAGEAGLLMCTFPRDDWDFAQASGKGKGRPSFAGYFNECMNGFEYQVAGHMIWEEKILEGLAITRAIHDRYHASKRNPWNEVECGDHYARSMASYGVFLAACGFEYHGPRGHIGFAPRLTPENFKAAFTAAEGWGRFSQKSDEGGCKFSIDLKYGQLRLQSLALALPARVDADQARVTANRRSLAAATQSENGRLLIRLSEPLTIDAGQNLEIMVPTR